MIRSIVEKDALLMAAPVRRQKVHCGEQNAGLKGASEAEGEGEDEDVDESKRVRVRESESARERE